MNEPHSFTYFISSANSATGTHCNDVEINIGPIGDNYDDYFVQCISICMNMDTLLANAPSFFYLVADDFAENGYNTFEAGTNGLTSRQIVLGAIIDNGNENVGIMNNGQGASFIVKNLRQKRRIRFRLYNALLEPEDDTYMGATTNWSCTLLLKPIK